MPYRKIAWLADSIIICWTGSAVSCLTSAKISNQAESPWTTTNNNLKNSSYCMLVFLFALRFGEAEQNSYQIYLMPFFFSAVTVCSSVVSTLHFSYIYSFMLLCKCDQYNKWMHRPATATLQVKSPRLPKETVIMLP